MATKKDAPKVSEAPKAKVAATPDKQVAEFGKAVAKFEAEAENIVKIKDQTEYAVATEFISRIQTQVKLMEKERKSWVDPLNEQVKRLNAMFKMRSQPAEELITKIKRAMSDYLIAEERKAREKEAKLLAAQEKKNQKAMETGKPINFGATPTVARPTNTVHAEAGRSTGVKKWKWELVDPFQVPREYLMIDERALNLAVLNGAREIAGVRIFEDIDVRVSTTRRP